ncbi:hypothetical protein N7455_008849 [Penicillium solitum]|uniref:uncharacterized protein n=1 Tax=Penicillium solitum TaxID=60172 RepID=UPI0032C471FB|nr:hypothetical protein N7455_008849 [Penicillium solitum]
MAEYNEVLKGYNDILDLRQAYAWNADSETHAQNNCRSRLQIMKFLRHVVTYGYLYDIQDHQIPALRAMVAQIEMLR